MQLRIPPDREGWRVGNLNLNPELRTCEALNRVLHVNIDSSAQQNVSDKLRHHGQRPMVNVWKCGDVLLGLGPDLAEAE